MYKTNRLYAMELVRSFQVGELSRRAFLQRMTAVMGSAAAVTILAGCEAVRPNGTVPGTVPPVTQEAAGGEGQGEGMAEMSAAGLVTAMVEYPDENEDEMLMGYLARPEDAESAPAIVVIQEWWGLNDHIMDVTNRLAQQGYVALAPDLYKGDVATEPDEARKLVMETDMPEAVREIQSAITYLLEQDFVSGDQVAVTGFCFGGGLTLMTATQDDRLAVAIPWYGSPLDPAQASEVTAPVLGLYGAEDGGIPVDAVRAMEKAMVEAGIDAEFVVYDGAGHAFFNDTRGSYNADAADDAWSRTLAALEANLGS